MESDFKEGADDDPHHVAEEAAAADIDGDEIAVALEVEGVDLALGGSRIAITGAKAGKVVPADKGARRFLHGGEIEILPNVPGSARRGGGPNRGVVDAVAVPFAVGGVAGVKVGALLGDLLNGDIVGEEAVDPFAKGGEGEGVFGAEMGDHGAGVDSGIGATGAVQHDLLADDLAEGLLDELLNRGAGGLALPADIVGAVVFNGEAKSSHRGGRIINPRSPCPEKSLVLPASFS